MPLQNFKEKVNQKWGQMDRPNWTDRQMDIISLWARNAL